MIDPAKKPQDYVLSGLQPSQDRVVRILGRIWNRTEPNHRPSPGPLAGCPDPLLILFATDSYLWHQECDQHFVEPTRYDYTSRCKFQQAILSMNCGAQNL
jgi:hypothetical protein